MILDYRSQPDFQPRSPFDSSSLRDSDVSPRLIGSCSESHYLNLKELLITLPALTPSAPSPSNPRHPPQSSPFLWASTLRSHTPIDPSPSTLKAGSAVFTSMPAFRTRIKLEQAAAAARTSAAPNPIAKARAEASPPPFSHSPHPWPQAMRQTTAPSHSALISKSRCMSESG